MQEMQVIIEEKPQNVVLVGVDLGINPDFEHSMEELKCLAQACGKQVVGAMTQRLNEVNKTYYIGMGKVYELKEYAKVNDASEVIFDETLSPSQIRNLSDSLGLIITDRTNLILEIFAIRAKTREAKLQVETARLQYMLPRLVGLHDSLGRQGGTSGSMSNKGVGEKKIELDRRKIEHRIVELEHELKIISSNRKTQRKKRDKSSTPKVALVGYTNAGKSTVMNKMVQTYGGMNEKMVLEKDMLFATLDTNVRSIEPENNRPFFLSDTVGFIDKLPHALVKAFQSTLEEVQYADLLVHVVDYSDEHFKQHMDVTNETLKELGAGNIPQIVCYNKIDLVSQDRYPQKEDIENAVYMSARETDAIRHLTERITQILYAKDIDCFMQIPYDKGDILSYLNAYATVLDKKYEADYVHMHVLLRNQDAAKMEMYRTEE